MWNQSIQDQNNEDNSPRIRQKPIAGQVNTNEETSHLRFSTHLLIVKNVQFLQTTLNKFDDNLLH
jgi:hypothetical protein